MTDLDERLTDLRHEPSWTPEERAGVLAAVLSSDPQPQRGDHPLAAVRPWRGRRRIAVVAAVGLAAAASIAVPAVLPNGTPGAADRAAAVTALHHLARIAAVSPADHLGPGEYLHIVDAGRQTATSGQPASSYRYESWIRSDGKTWQRRTDDDGFGPVQHENWVWPAGPQVVDGMTAPVYLDRLPTDPAVLESYLRSHTTGSTSADERVFVATNDIVRRGLAGPALRSAAIDVLAHLGHVRLGDETHDSLGHPVQAFDFVDPTGRSNEIQTVMFDTRTAQVTEDRDYVHGTLHAVDTRPTFDVVDSVPASVRSTAVPQKR